MPPAELLDIAVKMLDAEVVIHAIVAALQHCPERLHPVGVRLPAHILADAVLDGDMSPAQARVRAGLVGVHNGVRSRAPVNKAFKGSRVG